MSKKRIRKPTILNPRAAHLCEWEQRVFQTAQRPTSRTSTQCEAVRYFDSPPNVTANCISVMHFVSVEISWSLSCMKGIPTLWVPGTDHAGMPRN